MVSAYTSVAQGSEDTRIWLNNTSINFSDFGSKQQAPDADPKAIQQIDFTVNLDKAGNTRFYFILEEAEETVFKFSQGTVIVLKMEFHQMQSIVSFLSV